MEINNMELKVECFIDKGNVFNMSVIKEDRNKIYQKDVYKPSKKC